MVTKLITIIATHIFIHKQICMHVNIQLYTKHANNGNCLHDKLTVSVTFSYFLSGYYYV